MGILSKASGADFEPVTKACFRPALVPALGPGSTGQSGTCQTADSAAARGIPPGAVFQVRVPVR